MDTTETTQTVEIHLDPEVREVLERVSGNLEQVGDLLRENSALLKRVLQRPVELVGGALHVS